MFNWFKKKEVDNSSDKDSLDWVYDLVRYKDTIVKIGTPFVDEGMVLYSELYGRACREALVRLGNIVIYSYEDDRHGSLLKFSIVDDLKPDHELCVLRVVDNYHSNKPKIEVVNGTWVKDLKALALHCEDIHYKRMEEKRIKEEESRILREKRELEDKIKKEALDNRVKQNYIRLNLDDLKEN